jgi:hypothetical protein
VVLQALSVSRHTQLLERGLLQQQQKQTAAIRYECAKLTCIISTALLFTVNAGNLRACRNT